MSRINREGEHSTWNTTPVKNVTLAMVSLERIIYQLYIDTHTQGNSLASE